MKYYCMWVEGGLILSLSASVHAALQYRSWRGLDVYAELLPASLRGLTFNRTGRALWT